MRHEHLVIGLLALPLILAGLSGCSQDNAPTATVDGANATSAGTDSSSGNSGQIGNSQPTGKIKGTGLYFLVDAGFKPPYDSERNFTQSETTLTVYADDINNLTVDGWTVSFKTEWGTFLDGKDSCVLQNGSCSVRWQTGSPATAPGSCQVSFTVWAMGEEDFADLNDNGLLDPGEVFSDYEEPFLDVNEDGVYSPGVISPEGVTELIDVLNFDGTGGRNGIHDTGNGLYDGSYCAANNTAVCSGRSSVVIHYRGYLYLQDAFVDSNDLNNNGDTTEKIRFCNTNPY